MHCIKFHCQAQSVLFRIANREFDEGSLDMIPPDSSKLPAGRLYAAGLLELD